MPDQKRRRTVCPARGESERNDREQRPPYAAENPNEEQRDDDKRNGARDRHVAIRSRHLIVLQHGFPRDADLDGWMRRAYGIDRCTNRRDWFSDGVKERKVLHRHRFDEVERSAWRTQIFARPIDAQRRRHQWMRRDISACDIGDRVRFCRHCGEFCVARSPRREPPLFLGRNRRRRTRDERLFIEQVERTRECIDRSARGGVVARCCTFRLGIDRDHNTFEIAELLLKRAVLAHERPLGRDERIGVAVEREVEHPEPRAKHGEHGTDGNDRTRPRRDEMRKPSSHGRATSVRAPSESRVPSDSRLPSNSCVPSECCAPRRPPKSAFFPRRASSPTVAVGL